MHLADIPATLTITNALDETLVIATSIRLAPLAVSTVIQMAGRGPGDKSDTYQALFIAEQMGHIEAGGLSLLEDPVESGHTLFGGQDKIGDVEPEGRAGVLGIHTGAPTVGRPVLRGVTALTPLGVATGAPTVGAPALLGIAALTPLGIATGAPTVGSPELVDVPAVVDPPTWIEYTSFYTDTPSRDLGTGPFDDLSASFWMKTDDAANVQVTLIAAHGSSNSLIAIKIEEGQLSYEESSFNGNMWYHIWVADLPTDEEWHHYGVRAGLCYIDGTEVTFTDFGTGEAPGSVHPSVEGVTDAFMSLVVPAGKYVDLADVRIFKMDSDVQAQAGYNSTLLDDGSTTIVGAWLMADGTGDPADRSVQNTPLSLEAGMTWKP